LHGAANTWLIETDVEGRSASETVLMHWQRMPDRLTPVWQSRQQRLGCHLDRLHGRVQLASCVRRRVRRGCGRTVRKQPVWALAWVQIIMA
jgi:hypothetical protein